MKPRQGIRRIAVDDAIDAGIERLGQLEAELQEQERTGSR